MRRNDDRVTTDMFPPDMTPASVYLPPPKVTLRPLARNTDPATSHTAARSAKALAAHHHTLIIGALQRPSTATELAARTGLTQVQVCRRLPELEELKLARPTGNTRLTESGRPSREWERVKP